MHVENLADSWSRYHEQNVDNLRDDVHGSFLLSQMMTYEGQESAVTGGKLCAVEIKRR